ncbi:MAG: DNA replication/repair protein RecF [Bacteroidetes bacterium]|nr:DNA replication/repair protein RecF [Bacteroidota bacterium]
MHLQKLNISNFKNYEDADLSFSPKINCFVGNNGVGKTNILDAIHYLSFCKSYFNPVDTQNIRHEQSFFSIHGLYSREISKVDMVSCIQQLNHKKQFRLNKKDYDRLADHIGLFPLVMISPYDRDLINDGSDIRRKYIDSVISQFDRIYLENLMSYNKALQQRNALLKYFAEKRYFNADSLEIWDMKMIQHGDFIFRRRNEFLSDFIPVFRHYFEFVSGGKEEVDISYVSQLHDNSLEELLKESVERDIQIRYTSTGIHKDDLEFRITGHPIKKFGSQGQQKSFVVAIKLAQFDYTRKTKGFKPILLLDDIFDKLDDQRVGKIIELVGNDNFGQVFITDTQKQRIEKLFQSARIEHKIYEIEAGKASEIPNGN